VQHEYVIPWQPAGHIRSHQKEFAKYSWRMYSRWQIALISVVSSNCMIYANMISIPIKKYRYIWHTSSLILQAAHISLMLHGQYCIRYENVFTSCIRRPQDIPRSPCPRCAVMVSCMTNIQLIPHDMDCPQARLILRGRVRNSHHPTGGNLPSYLCVGASLQNSKLHKVNTKSKTQLACHLIILYNPYLGI
jgi:hypothetical protein